MPTTASTLIESRNATSSSVVMPPAAVSLRVVASANGLDRCHVCSLHQPFAIDVRVQELARVWLERAHCFSGGQVEHRPPAVDDDVTAAAVDGGDKAVGRDRFRHTSGELEIDGAAFEEGRREDDAGGAERYERLRSFGCADAAADAAGQPRADGGDERLVRAGVLGRVEVDELHL